MFINSKSIEYILAFFLSLLVFIWPIEGTIGLRNTLVFLLLFTLLFYYKGYIVLIELFKTREIKVLFTLLFILLSWMIYQAFFISTNTNEVLNEIRGQFLTPVLCFVLGMSLFINKYTYINKRMLFNIIFISSFIHVVLILFYNIYTYIFYNSLSYRTEFLIRIDEMSFYTNLVFLFFIAEVFFRVKCKEKYLFFSNNILFLIYFIFIVSVSFQGMRLGVLTFILSNLFFITLILILSDYSKLKKTTLLSFLSLGLLFLLGYSLEKDKRWNTFYETILIAYENESLYWLDRHKYSAPILESGDIVDLSNYLRIAQQINGYKLIMEYPNGIGYSRRAYKNVLIDKYNEGYGHPHSGMINLILGIGILGIIIYMAFLVKILKIAFFAKYKFYSFFVIFLIITFHARTLVDMTFQNHILQIFLFLLGIGLIGCLKKENSYEES